MSITNINQLNEFIANKIKEGATSIRLDIDFVGLQELTNEVISSASHGKQLVANLYSKQDMDIEPLDDDFHVELTVKEAYDIIHHVNHIRSKLRV